MNSFIINNQSIFQYIVILVLLLVLMRIVLVVENYLKEKINNANYRIAVEYAVDIDDINDELDKFIKANLDEYVLLNVAYQKDLIYINSETEKKICDKVTAMVSDRISERFIEKMKFIYSSDGVSQIIAIKVFLAVTDYCMSYNTPKQAPSLKKENKLLF